MNKQVIIERLAALRKEMKAHKMDYYLIGSEDFHGSEYVGEHFKCRAYISGFTGSAGTVVVTQDFAGLWTDGRYHLQASQQLEETGITLFKMGLEGVVDYRTFIIENIGEGQCLGFDGRTVNARDGQDFKVKLAAKHASVNGTCDLMENVWQDRPALSAEPAWLLDIAYTGESREERIEKIRKMMLDQKADAFVLTSLDDIAWLLNFRGNDVMDNPVVLSYLLMTKEQIFLYVNDIVFKKEDQETLNRAGVIFRPYEAVYEDLKHLDNGIRVIYDGAKTNYAILECIPEQITLKDEENLTSLPKAIKNAVEVENIRQAHIKDGVAVVKFRYWLKEHAGKEPMTEISVANQLEAFRKQQEGYIEPSFEPICGYGYHGAIIHYSATEESNIPVEAKGLLLMDTGAQYLQGTTDITRTFVMGELTEEEKLFYTLVLRGHLNLGGAKFLYGSTGQTLDYLAREPLWERGLNYNHGTGHGVGYLLNVHEGPCDIRWKPLPNRKNQCVLEEGMVMSNEPGYYLEGKFGIRHENMIVCVKAEKNEFGQFMCFENLTMVPFDLEGINTTLLNEREIKLLNTYHKKIYDTISPYLTEGEAAWLKQATRPL